METLPPLAILDYKKVNLDMEHPEEKYASVVVQRGKNIRLKNPILELISGLVIYSMFIPVLIIDISLSIYQFVYFSVHDIPKVKRSEYIVIDRQHLKNLNPWQKFNCAYCGYVNGVVNWADALAAQTEIYSCAIKHWHPAKGQDHQKNFYNRKLFNSQTKEKEG